MRRPAVPPVPEPEKKGAEPRVRVLRVFEENTGTAVRFRFRPKPGCFTGGVVGLRRPAIQRAARACPLARRRHEEAPGEPLQGRLQHQRVPSRRHGGAPDSDPANGVPAHRRQGHCAADAGGLRGPRWSLELPAAMGHGPRGPAARSASARATTAMMTAMLPLRTTTTRKRKRRTTTTTHSRCRTEKSVSRELWPLEVPPMCPQPPPPV